MKKNLISLYILFLKLFYIYYQVNDLFKYIFEMFFIFYIYINLQIFYRQAILN